MKCEPGEVGGPSAVCGEPFDASDDTDAPVIAIVMPQNGTRIDSAPGAGTTVTAEVPRD